MKTRTLKVGAQVHAARSFPRRAMRVLPKVLLQGDWLEAAGFAPGDRITVKPLPNGLIIVKQ